MRQFLLTHDSGSLWLIMVMSEHMQDSVHKQEGQFVVRSSGMLRRLACCDGWTDDNVSEN
jgi:hypothetical protein